MSEGRGKGFRLGRRRRDAVPAAEVPCIPCGQQEGLRPFALNADTIDRIDDDLVPSFSPSVAYGIAGAEVVLFDPAAQTSTLLNASVALIWASIDGEGSVATIVDDLASETGADRELIATDVRETVARFVDAGIVIDPFIESMSDPATAADAPAAPAQGAADDRRAQRIDSVLARRSWTLDTTRRCCDANVRIRTDGDEVAALLAPLLVPLPLPLASSTSDATTTISIVDRGRPSPRRYRLLLRSGAVRFAETAEHAIDLLFTELNDIALNSTAGRVVLHAGAVERDGSVVVVAGPSGRGKSTLTAALMRRGWRYVTDEVAAIDVATRGVLPYPKPIDLDPTATALVGLGERGVAGGKVKFEIDQVGATGDGSGRVDLIVLLDDPERTERRTWSRAEMLVELLSNTFASTFDGAPSTQVALDSVVGLVAAVPVLILDRLPIDDAIGAVESRLDDDRPAAAGHG